MSYYSSRRSSREYDRWPAYVPVAARRAKAEKEVAKLAKKGQTISPVKITGTKIATTFWGKAWCDNLESYGDFENRLPRGRTYVRNGSVVDLQIAPLGVTAIVSGSELYRVSVTVAALPKPKWQSICKDCAGGIDSLVELLQGRFSKGVMERLCRQDQGLFPKPSEIAFTCSCPDYASMCKHVAAVLYGVGARLDQRPELLFQLRAVEQSDLIAHVDISVPLSKTGPDADKVLVDDDMAALFGLDMAEPDGPALKGTATAKAKAPAKKKLPAWPIVDARPVPRQAAHLVVVKAKAPAKAKVPAKANAPVKAKAPAKANAPVKAKAPAKVKAPAKAKAGPKKKALIPLSVDRVPAR